MIAIQKSATEEIRVSWWQRAGRYYMEVRRMYPTEKRISLLMDQVPELIDALQKGGEAAPRPRRK